MGCFHHRPTHIAGTLVALILTVILLCLDSETKSSLSALKQNTDTLTSQLARQPIVATLLRALERRIDDLDASMATQVGTMSSLADLPQRATDLEERLTDVEQRLAQVERVLSSPALLRLRMNWTRPEAGPSDSP